MLRTRGDGIQDNWDLWINASVFAYNTTVSSSAGVMPHYSMFRKEATLPVDKCCHFIPTDINDLALFSIRFIFQSNKL